MSAFDRFLNSVWAEARGDGGALLRDFTGPQTDAERVQRAIKLPQVAQVVDDLAPEFGAKNAASAGQLLSNVPRGRSGAFAFSEAVRLSPPGSAVLEEAFEGRAGAHLAFREAQAARQDFSRLVSSQDPTRRVRAHLGLSAAWELQGEWAAAEAALRSAASVVQDTAMEVVPKAALTGDIIVRLKRVEANLKAGVQVQPMPPFKVQSGLNAIPKLLGGPHISLPTASSAVDLKVDAHRGRHLVANRDIPAGSAVVVEPPYAWSLTEAQMTSHCLYCCAPALAPLPCPSCVYAVFCSERCLSEALSYHLVECPVLGHLVRGHELSAMALLVFRIVVTASGLSAGLQVVDSHDAEVKTLQLPEPFLQMFKEKGARKSKHRQSRYRAMFEQLTHSSSRSAADLLKRSLTAVFLGKCLQRALQKYGAQVAPCDEQILCTAFLRHLQSCSCNAYQISEHQVPGGDVRRAEGVEIGGAAYPTVSLINHACDPNVVRHSHGNVCVVRASRRIRKGTELLDNYGPHFLEKDVEERRLELEKQYFFRCDCRACAQNWPEIEDLRKQASVYKCSHCGHRLVEAGAVEDLRSVRQCPKCKKKRNYNEVINQLSETARSFSQTVQGLLQGCVDEALQTALAYTARLDEVVARPNAEIARANQVAGLCWSLMGNKVET